MITLLRKRVKREERRRRSGVISMLKRQIAWPSERKRLVHRLKEKREPKKVDPHCITVLPWALWLQMI